MMKKYSRRAGPCPTAPAFRWGTAPPCLIALILLCAVILPAGAAPLLSPGQSHWFSVFEPRGVPWLPAEEKNYEEVFKDHAYYELRQTADALEVSYYLGGRPVSKQRYRWREDGGLEPLPGGTDGGPAVLFAQHCASCHGADRLGITGPALMPESLERLGRKRAAQTIYAGRPATQMPGFGTFLSSEQIEALVDLIFTAPEVPPVWGEAQIRASHVVNHAPGPLPDRPVFSADPLNLFVVVESGDHHITILDGDRLEPIQRFATRYALHGGPKYSPDGRYVYLASRDGWITKYDIYNLQTVAEIRAGINTRNLAVSGDGRWVLVGNYLPHSLVLLDSADLSLLRVVPVAGADGTSSRVRM